MAMTRLNGNHFRDGEEQFIDTSGWESIHHGANDSGGCDVPWCTYSTDVEGSEHINIDRVLNEPGRFNSFKQNENLLRNTQEMRRILLNEFQEEVGENADAHLVATHDLTLMVLRLLKTRAEGRNAKIAAIAQEREKYMSQVGSVVSYIYDTFPLRANAIDPTGEMDGSSVAIALMEQLRRDLNEMQEQLTDADGALSMPCKHEGDSCKHEGEDAEPFCNLKRHESDTYQPQARRERTLNELHTLLHNMLLSGVDVAVRDLQDYLARHANAVHALVMTSVQLENSGSSEAVIQFLTWLRDDFTDSFRVSQKADELLQELMN